MGNVSTDTLYDPEHQIVFEHAIRYYLNNPEAKGKSIKFDFGEKYNAVISDETNSVLIFEGDKLLKTYKNECFDIVQNLVDLYGPTEDPIEVKGVTLPKNGSNAISFDFYLPDSKLNFSVVRDREKSEYKVLTSENHEPTGGKNYQNPRKLCTIPHLTKRLEGTALETEGDSTPTDLLAESFTFGQIDEQPAIPKGEKVIDLELLMDVNRAAKIFAKDKIPIIGEEIESPVYGHRGHKITIDGTEYNFTKNPSNGQIDVHYSSPLKSFGYGKQAIYTQETLEEHEAEEYAAGLAVSSTNPQSTTPLDAPAEPTKTNSSEIKLPKNLVSPPPQTQNNSIVSPPPQTQNNSISTLGTCTNPTRVQYLTIMLEVASKEMSELKKIMAGKPEEAKFTHYYCQANVRTIGFGTTSFPADVSEIDGVTAFDWMNRDLAAKELVLESAFGKETLSKLKPNEYLGVWSQCYNIRKIGSGLIESVQDLAKENEEFERIKSEYSPTDKKYIAAEKEVTEARDKVCEVVKSYNKVRNKNGDLVVSQGLNNRRTAEAALIADDIEGFATFFAKWKGLDREQLIQLYADTSNETNSLVNTTSNTLSKDTVPSDLISSIQSGVKQPTDPSVSSSSSATLIADNTARATPTSSVSV